MNRLLPFLFLFTLAGCAMGEVTLRNPQSKQSVSCNGYDSACIADYKKLGFKPVEDEEKK
ncbi:hypothetical protein GC177_10545 [bacterium]|nr:hypothetical protein [bacterium]